MEDWIRVASFEDIPENGAFTTEYEGKLIAVFQNEGRAFAIEDWCPHMSARLSGGVHEGFTIECPLHKVVYSITTGSALSEPNWGAARAFPTRVVDGEVEIDWSKRQYTPEHP